MPKRIILVRHGQTDFNKERIIQGHLDTFLSKEGLEQAIVVAEKLNREKIDVIFSSDLKRAFQTASVIAQKLKKKVITSKLLRERNFGELQGLKGEEVAKKYRFELSELYWSTKTLSSVIKSAGVYTKIESDEKMLIRFARFFAKLKKYKDKSALLVIHGGSIRVILKFLKLHKQADKAGHFKNTSITILEKTTHGYIIKSINQ